jgi:S1-C subfamily serine protease
MIRKGESMKRKIYLLLVMSLLIFGLVACRFSGESLLPQLPGLTVPTQIQNLTLPAIPDVTEAVNASVMISDKDILVNLFDKVNPGVVAIKTVTAQGGGLGSGFIFDNAGHIVTNYHVVEGATELEVDFPSGFKVMGNVVGTDLDSDIAVIKVDVPAGELHPLSVGDSEKLHVGQFVVAIGNPFGLDSTMTYGIISALGRTLDSMRQTQDGQSNFSAGALIQTDAAINPGNSGGPLFNLDGEVIGLNRAIRTEASNTTGEPINSGIGFAIPSSLIRRVVPVLIEKGRYDYPYLGITSMDDLPLQLVEQLGLKSFRGAYITSVVPGGPAEQAGLQAGAQNTSTGLGSGGDLIIAIDGRQVKTFDEMLSYLIVNKSPGDVVTLTVMRGDQQLDIPVTLAARP